MQSLPLPVLRQVMVGNAQAQKRNVNPAHLTHCDLCDILFPRSILILRHSVICGTDKIPTPCSAVSPEEIFLPSLLCVQRVCIPLMPDQILLKAHGLLVGYMRGW